MKYMNSQKKKGISLFFVSIFLWHFKVLEYFLNNVSDHLLKVDVVIFILIVCHVHVSIVVYRWSHLNLTQELTLLVSSGLGYLAHTQALS